MFVYTSVINKWGGFQNNSLNDILLLYRVVQIKVYDRGYSQNKVLFFFFTWKLKTFVKNFFYRQLKKCYKYLKNPKSLIWINVFINKFPRLFKEIQVLDKNQMAYQKFAFNFTFIGQIVYEIYIYKLICTTISNFF